MSELESSGDHEQEPAHEHSVRAEHPYRLVCRKLSDRYRDNLDTRPVQVGSAVFGGDRPTVIAGPCVGQ